MNQTPWNMDGSATPPLEGLATEVVRFAHFLKVSGFRAFPTRTSEALLGIAMIDLLNRRDFMAALRIHFAGSHAGWRRFPDLFEAFWGKPEESTPQEEAPPGERPGDSEGVDASNHEREWRRYRKNEGTPEEETPSGASLGKGT